MNSFFNYNEIPDNIFVANEEEFMDHQPNLLVYDFDLFDDYIMQNDIKIIFINNNTFYLYHRCEFDKYLKDNGFIMIYFDHSSWNTADLSDDLIYIDRIDESKYLLLFRENKELISLITDNPKNQLL